MKTSVEAIARVVGGCVIGDGGTVITGFKGIREAGAGDLTFVADVRYVRHMQDTRASALLVPPDISDFSRPLIQVENPAAAFTVAVQKFNGVVDAQPKGIHPSAVIEEDVILGDNAAIGAHVYIGKGVELAANVVVYPNTYIGPRCSIGESTILYPNVVIREGCIIGAHCIIHNGASIGSDGFGFAIVNGKHEKIPQLGNVVIGDDVDIGANASIDRARFGSTVIKQGTKIDNLVQIGHNTEIGENCIICGTVGISGSAHIGDYVTLAAGAGIAGHLEIGSHVTVGGMSGVTKSIPSGMTVSGFPAVDHRIEKRRKAAVRMLPDTLRRVRSLEERIAQLESLLHGRETENNT